MKTSRLFLFLLAGICGLFVLTCSGCAPDRLGMLAPDPNTKPSSGVIPDGDPFDPDNPNPPTPVDPDDPMNAIVNNPERLARIGKTPIIEVY